MTTRSHRGLRAALLCLLLAGGCKQGFGDRCQVDGDCEDCLYCELAGSSVAMGGSCRRRATPECGGGMDLSVPQDLSVPPDQSMPDLAPGPDLTATDGTNDTGN